ncbi:MAG: sigma-70 family RNA polymerase sigma factor [Pseudomonadota bacterium]
MVDVSDAALLARVALGDRGAFQTLYRRTSPRLLAIALSMLQDRTQAEDVLQEAYVKVWYSADMFDAAKGEVVPWMIAIVRHLAIDRLRKTKPPDIDRMPEDGYSPQLGEDSQRLQECLETLESEQRQSIFAAFFQGLTHHEIAARFEVPIGTIKSRVRRGLKALKGCLET